MTWEICGLSKCFSSWSFWSSNVGNIKPHSTQLYTLIWLGNCCLWWFLRSEFLLSLTAYVAILILLSILMWGVSWWIFFIWTSKISMVLKHNWHVSHLGVSNILLILVHFLISLHKRIRSKSGLCTRLALPSDISEIWLSSVIWSDNTTWILYILYIRKTKKNSF